VNRLLIIGNAEREAAQRLVEYASKPENIYYPGQGVRVPGNDPNHTLQLMDFRCVFSYTGMDGMVWKHLSISVPAKGKLPSPVAVQEIAHLFGIGGTVDEWAERGHVSPNKAENCIVVAQPIPPISEA
jgi:hypothetical protein